MIDLHAHIIHGVDDGPKTLEASLALVRQAADQGVRHIIATPHYKLPIFDNYQVDQNFKELEEAIQAENLNITLSLGNEVYTDEQAIQQLKNGHAHTLGATRYILLELPEQRLYPVHYNQVYDLQREGYKVILAHVDRYSFFNEKPETLKGFISRGCYTQLSADFIVKKPKLAKKMIQEGLVHLVASDMHSCERRPNRMQEAYRLIEKQLGKKVADTLTQDNPSAVIADRPLTCPTLYAPKRSWLAQFIG